MEEDSRFRKIIISKWSGRAQPGSPQLQAAGWLLVTWVFIHALYFLSLLGNTTTFLRPVCKEA